MAKELPPEILVQVFQNLSEEILRKSVSFVSKKWYQILQEFDLVERRIVWCVVKEAEKNDLFHDLKKFPTFGRRVKSVKIKQDYHYAEDFPCTDFFPVAKALQFCNMVEELRLTILDEETLIDALSVLTNSEKYLAHIKLFEISFQKVDIDYSSKTYQLEIAKWVNNDSPSLKKALVLNPTSMDPRNCV